MTSLALALLLAPASAVELDFDGIVALPGCSGALFHYTGQSVDDRALVLTNGHCIGRLGAHEVLVHEPYETEITLYDAGMEQAAVTSSWEIVYATMHHTDMAVLALDETYAEIRDQLGIESILLDDERGVVGEEIAVLSGLWEYSTTCELDGFVDHMIEGVWEWSDSIRMTEECVTFGGTSGSPILSVATGHIIGVNNTGYEGGKPCSVNNPCEVGADGERITIPDGSYGQQTVDLYDCIDVNFELDLERPECGLPRPKGVLSFGEIVLSTGDECDGDGIFDGGETGVLTVRIENDGPVALSETTVELVGGHPALQASQNQAQLGPIGPWAYVTAEFELGLDVDIEDLAELDLEVVVRDPGAAESELTKSVPLRVHYDSNPGQSSLDDVESAETSWTVTGELEAWARASQDDNTVWYGRDLGEPGDVALVSGPMLVGQGNLALSFSHRHRFETSDGVNYDGGVVEVTTDGGQTWLDASTLTDAGYGGVITDESGNPLANRMAFVDESADWPETERATLRFGRSLAGELIQVRFRIGTDAAVGDFGWAIDDIELTGLVHRPFAALGPHDDSCGEDVGIDEPVEAGCGCSGSGGGAGWLAGLLPLAMVRRRRS